MSLLIVLIIGLILISVLVWGAECLKGALPANIVMLIQAAIVLVGALLLAQRLGIF